jgi:hypothetical protein
LRIVGGEVQGTEFGMDVCLDHEED